MTKTLRAGGWSAALLVVWVTGAARGQATRPTTVSGWVRGGGGDLALTHVSGACVEVRRQDWGEFRVNRTIWDGALQVGSKRYEHGLHTHATSEVVVHLGGKGKRFLAEAGVDRNADTIGQKGSCDFHVEVGGKEVWGSGVRRSSDEAAKVDVDLGGAEEFVLKVGEGGDGYAYDQADWAEARVEMGDGRVVRLDELPVTGAPAVVVGREVPFSMKIGGRVVKEWEKRDGGAGVVTYRDAASGVEVDVEVRTFAGWDAADWVMRVRNTADKVSPRIEQIRPLDMEVKLGGYGEAVFRSIKGSSDAADDFLPVSSKMEVGKGVELAPAGGRPSNGVFPMWNVEYPGGGMVFAVGWSGEWAGHLERTGDRRVKISVGQRDCSFVLGPGEEVRTPRVLVYRWEGADAGVGRSGFRRLMLENYVPRVGKGSASPRDASKREGEVAVPPVSVFPGWYFDNYNGIDEGNQLACVEKLRGLGAEAFWMDTGWFPGGWPGGVGNWEADRKKFPRGLGVIGKECHREGVKYILWFEPERVARGSELAKARPGDCLAVGGGGDLLYNLGNKGAREYLEALLAKRIEEFHIDVLRIDFNMDPLAYWEAADDRDHVGLTEARYVEGLYELWDHLRARFPGLVIDNCASGGRRIDLETVSRSVALWRSDTACEPRPKEETDQVETAGLQQYVPMSAGGVWLTDPYHVRSGATVGVNLQGNPMDPAYPVEEVRAAAGEVRELRPMWMGDFYPVVPVTLDPAGWCGWQCHRGDLQRGFVMLFRREEAPYSSVDLALRGIEPGAVYEVQLRRGYGRGEVVRMKGEELARYRAVIPGRKESLLVLYRKVGG